MKNKKKDSLYSELFNRISDRLGGESAIKQVAPWLEKHTKLEGRPWSFKNHEFQIKICNSTKRLSVTQKPTQVGLTELSIRLSLALCAMRNHFPLIYVFPSAKFAAEVGKTRVDPVISSSERLSELVGKVANSATVKSIGTSFMYMGGAESKRQAISRPARALVFDEKDFANQEILTAYYSRLGHVHEEDQLIREFSTPTVGDYGINLSIMKSTRQRYMCKCVHCGERQAPEFATQVRIPGWEGESFYEFSKDDLLNPKILVSEAYLACRKCGKDLILALRDPNREWVEMFPGRDTEGFEVKPFDLIAYNSIPKLVRAFGDYSSESDYWNFRQGEVFQSDTNSVNLEKVRNSFTLPTLGDEKLYGLCFGLDVGYTYCYAMAGIRVREGGITRTHVVWRKRYASKDGSFIQQVLADLDQLGPSQAVCDIGPDRSLSRAFATHLGRNSWAAAYRKDKREALSYFDRKEEESVVAVQRTKGFNALVKEINDGKWKFNAGPDHDTVVLHMGGMKRVQQVDDEGELSEQWVKTGGGEDHYLHAAMYLKVALDLLDGGAAEAAPSVLPCITGVGLGSKLDKRDKAEPDGYLDRNFTNALRMFKF